MKWIVRLLIGLVALVALVFGAGAIFLATIDPNDYKDLIAKKVHEATGRTLTIDGDIELSFFPWLGLELGQARLSNAPGFGEDPFARVDEVQVRVALLPLLSREVEADTVTLQGLRLNLSRSEEGVTNWHDLVSQEAAEEAGKPEKPASDESAAGLAVAVGGINIQNAALHWQDAQTGDALVVSPFNLETGALKPGEPFELNMDVAVDNQNPPLQATAQLAGEVTVEPRQQRYRFEGMTLVVDAQGESLPGGRLGGELHTSAVADLQAQTLSVSTLKVQAMELALMGQFEVSQLLDAPQMNGSLEAAPFSPRQLLEQLGMQRTIPEDPKALERASLALQFRGSGEAVEISSLKATVDDSTLTGKANIESLEKPRIRFSLALDQMNLDSYLPPPAEEAPQNAPGAPTGGAKQGPPEDDLGVPVEALRELDLAGDLKAGQLQVANLQLSNVIAELRAKAGVVTVKPLRTVLYGGGIDSGLSMDVRGPVPAVSMKAELKAVQMGPLMAALQQGKGYLDGTGNVSLNLQTRGAGVADLQRLLDGKLNLKITEGALYDKELAAKVEAAVAFLEGRPPKPAGDAILFESLTGSANVNKGVVSNRDLQLITSLILAKGEGTSNLATSTLDYTLSLALARGGEDKKRVFVPITVKGPYADLNYGLDLKKIAKEQLQEKAEKRIDKELEKVVPKDLGAPLQEGLKGLLGR